MVALRAAGYKHGRTEFYAAEPRRIMEVKLAVAKCNVDDNQDLAMKYGVMSIPTLIVFKNGEEIDRSVGALPKARLQALLEKHL